VLEEQLEGDAFLQGAGAQQLVARELAPAVRERIVLDEAISRAHELEAEFPALHERLVAGELHQRAQPARFLLQRTIVAEQAERQDRHGAHGRDADDHDEQLDEREAARPAGSRSVRQFKSQLPMSASRPSPPGRPSRPSVYTSNAPWLPGLT